MPRTYKTTARKCAKLSMRDRCYIAGLIDMCGCIGMYDRSDRPCKRLNLALLLTDRDVLDWLAKTTGVGRVWEVRPNKSHWKQIYRWGCVSEAAATLLQQVVPHLKTKTHQERAKQLVAFQKSLRPKGFKVTPLAVAN
jgi:hypothetical protein